MHPPGNALLSATLRPPAAPAHRAPGYRCPTACAPAAPLINIKDRVRDYVPNYAMNENLTSANEVICPVCGRPMILLHTIRRAFAENLNVFKCKPCGFSTTEPVSWTTPPLSQNVSATTAARQKRSGGGPRR
jgi:predicted RNA-binding Zn-ribbon protein involved in translation (DUF1610 family)